jgi:transposase
VSQQHPIRKDSDDMSFLSRLPQQTASVLTDVHLKQIKVAIGSVQYLKHIVDTRGTIPVSFTQYPMYFLLLMGHRLRALNRRAKSLVLTALLILTSLFLLLCALGGLVMLYLFKSALGINLVDGLNEAKIAVMLKVSRASVNKWVANDLNIGLPGLDDRPSPGRPAKLTPPQSQKLADFINNPSCSPKGGRLIEAYIQQYIEQHFAVRYQPSNVYSLIHELGLSWITLRSKHPKQSQEAQDSFKNVKWQSSSGFRVMWCLRMSIFGFRTKRVLANQIRPDEYVMAS